MDRGQLQGFLLMANIAETGTARQECLEVGDVINVFRLP